MNTNIALLAQGINGLGVYDDSLKYADTWLERKKNAEMANIERQTQDVQDVNDRFEQMIGLAKKSKRSPWLIADIEAQKGAMAKAELESRKTNADINKTISETNENNAKATETMTGVGKARMDMTKPMWEIMARTGNTDLAQRYIKQAYSTGAIDETSYQAYMDELGLYDGLSSDEVMAVSQAVAMGQLDPKYLYVTSDNQLDNDTSRLNNANDNKTSLLNNMEDNATKRFGHMVDREGNQMQYDAKMAQIESDQEIAQFKAAQEEAIRSGQVKEVMTGTDGNSYLIYADGRVEKALDGVALSSGSGAKTQQATTKMEEQQRIQKVNMITQEMRELINQSTGSGIGKIWDLGARAFGVATDGDMALARLETLSGQLISLMPKMSGPQSDKDVQLYKQMAGDVDNGWLPVERRLAALDEIVRLNEKYAQHQDVKLPTTQTSGNPFAFNRPSVGSFFE